MARGDQQLKFRVPAELKESLDAAAAANRRSLNAEIIARLEATFPPPGFEQKKRYEIARHQRDDALRNLKDIQERLARIEAEMEQFKPPEDAD